MTKPPVLQVPDVPERRRPDTDETPPPRAWNPLAYEEAPAPPLESPPQDMEGVDTTPSTAPTSAEGGEGTA